MVRSSSAFRAAFLTLTLLGKPLPARADISGKQFPPFKLGFTSQVVSAGFELVPLPPLDTATKLTYRPAQSNYVGIILGYKWLSGTVSFSIPAPQEIRDREGVSKYRDYRLSYFTRQFGVELTYSRYFGYLIENSQDLSAATRSGEEFYKIPDLETLGYGINFFWVLRPAKFSLPAAFDQSEIQEKSGGSLLAFGAWRAQAITSGSALIPVEKQNAFGTDQLLNVARSQNFAVGGGYAYNFVPVSFLFVSAMGGASVGYQTVDYEDLGTAARHTSGTVNIHLRLAAGTNTRHFFATVGFYADRFQQNTESLQIGNSVYGFTISTGVRF